MDNQKEMKIAVIFESSPFDRKGQFNAAHNRTLNLAAHPGLEVDAYCMHIRDSFLTRWARHTPKVPVRNTVEVDGVVYNMMWRRFFWLDYLREKLRRTPKKLLEYVAGQAERFSSYDVIIAHSYEAGLLALAINKAYGIPYMITWHGSDVHTHPLKNKARLQLTADIMEKASVNFFVSAKLMETSNMISECAPKAVLYNGVSDAFRQLDPDERLAQRMKYGINENDKVIAYVGNFYPVKNVGILPRLFAEVQDDFDMHLRDNIHLDMNLKFWVVGDGRLRKKVESDIKMNSSAQVKFWGNVDADEMPYIMACIDILVLPSINEGLPLVAIEALKCGAAVVGSDVGGISEVIGKDFCIPFDVSLDGSYDHDGQDFVKAFAQKVVKQVFYPQYQHLDPRFDWKKTAQKEISYLCNLVNQNDHGTEKQQ